MDSSAAHRFDRAYFTTVYRDYQRQNPPRKLASYERLLERHLESAPHRRILDVGCGPGYFLASLDAQWMKFGIDVSAYAIEMARTFNPTARLVVGSGANIPFGAAFDAVVSLDVMEHLPDPAAAFDDVFAHLRPGGVFLFVVPVYDGLSGPIIRRLDRDPTHLHKRPRAFWIELAERRFQIEEWIGLVRYLLPGGLYVSLSTRTFRRHAPAVAVVARRPR